MAATERRVRRARARRPKFSKWPWLVAGLGALAARDARAQQTLVDTRLLFYKESDGRTQVLNPTVFLQRDFGSRLGSLGLLLGYDTITGASPSGGYPTSDTVTSASGNTSTAGHTPQVHYHDTRKSASLSYARPFGAHLPSVDLSYSKENDYTARSVGLSDAWTMLRGRGTLHLGASFSRDIVAPVTNSLQLDKKTNAFALGWTWILGERDLLDVSASLMKLSGYLDDPYKIVPVGALPAPVDAPEHRPDTRTRRAIVGKYGHYFLWDGAIKATYRYYWDDWSVRAHTLDLVYDQHVDEDWIISPELRFYTQTGASFYGSVFTAPQTYMSSDYRLSPFDSVLFGLTVGYKLDDRTTLSVGATQQSQRGRDRVTPIATSGGATGGSIAAADMKVTTVTVGLSYRY